MNRCRRDDDRLTRNCPYARECMDLVRLCGVRRLASLIAECMEWYWDPTLIPTDELTDELRGRFSRLWERADRVEVIILFLFYLENSKDLDLPPIGGIGEAGVIQIETPSDMVYEAVCGHVMFIVNANPGIKAYILCKVDICRKFIQEVGDVSAVAEFILSTTMKPNLRRTHMLYFKLCQANGMFGFIPSLILCIARGDELAKLEYAPGVMRMSDISLETFELRRVVRRFLDSKPENFQRYITFPLVHLVVCLVDVFLVLFWLAVCSSKLNAIGNELISNDQEAEFAALEEAEAEEGPIQEVVANVEYAPGMMRMRDISLETFELQRVMRRFHPFNTENLWRYTTLPPVHLVVCIVDLFLVFFNHVWVASKAYFEHLGDL